MRQPLAILISDVHYSLNTIGVADAAFRTAIDKAAELNVPLIDCGDLTNDKAMLRAEYVNAILYTMKYAKAKNVKVYALVGNHSLINERWSDHALSFLEGSGVTIVAYPTYLNGRLYLIPYQPSPKSFMQAFPGVSSSTHTIIIGHQGTIGGKMGDYIRDPSAVDYRELHTHKVFLGHYHAHYTLGTTVSIGNPYTLTFGEANDGPKGFLVLYSDGTFDRVILPFRRHRIIELRAGQAPDIAALGLGYDDLLWFKVRGTVSELDKVNKGYIAEVLGCMDFKLDKIPVEADTPKVTIQVPRTTPELMDGIVDDISESEDYKEKLKALWRTLS